LDELIPVYHDTTTARAQVRFEAIFRIQETSPGRHTSS
jgi:hypothetical protein